MQKRAFSESESYETHYDPLPVRGNEPLYYDKKSVYLPLADDFPFMHYHTRYEIGEVVTGDGEIISEGKFYAARKGDIIFIPSGAKHYSRSIDKNVPCYVIFAYIDSSLVNSIAEVLHSDIPDCDIPAVICERDYPVLVSILRGIIEVCGSDSKKKAEAVALRIATFLFEAERYFELQPETKNEKSRKDKSISLVAEYISLHYGEEINSKKLASMCHLSESQLRRNFYIAYGCSPIFYRNRLRLEIGKELLLHSDLSVGMIAEKLGYSTSSDFCRSFKKRWGLSPTKTRNA